VALMKDTLRRLVDDLPNRMMRDEGGGVPSSTRGMTRHCATPLKQDYAWALRSTGTGRESGQGGGYVSAERLEPRWRTGNLELGRAPRKQPLAPGRDAADVV